jgi:hypothetical protein
MRPGVAITGRKCLAQQRRLAGAGAADGGIHAVAPGEPMKVNPG